jgi:RNA polymerase sigma factor (sigma-70 family)
MPAALMDLLHYLGRMRQPPAGADLTDAQLLQRFLVHREETAFGLLVQRHGPMVLGVCRRVLGQAEGAEDSFQATFLVLVRKAAAIRKKASLASWLYGVARRIAAKVRAQAAQRQEWERRSLLMPRQEHLDEPTLQELRAVLDEEIDSLPEKYRAPLVLCYFEGKSHDQAGRELGLPRRSVTSRLARGRELLRGRLVRRGVTLSAGALVAALGELAGAAPVGALLTLTTVRAASRAADGKVIAGGDISERVATLAQSACHGKSGATVRLLPLLLTAAVAVGGAVLAGQGTDQPKIILPPQEKAASAPAQPAVAGEKKSVLAADLYGDALPEGALARLGTVRFRLGNGIYNMALAPDGRTAVTVGGNSVTQFWDVATGKLVRQIDYKDGGGGRVVACSPDGKLVATVQDRAELYLWDAAAGKSLTRLPLPMTFTTSLAFSPDSTILAVGGSQTTYGNQQQSKSNSIVALWRWDGTKLQPLWEAKPDQEAPLGPRSHAIQALAFSPDGKRLATGGHNNSIIRIWNVAECKEVGQCKSPGTQVGALAFLPGGKALASGSDDGTLILWEADTRTRQWESKQPGEVRGIAVAPGGKVLAVGGGPEYGWNAGKKNNEPFLVLVDAGTGKDLRPLSIARNSVAGLAFSEDGKVLAAGLGGALRIWEGTGKERLVGGGHEHWIGAVALADDGRLAVTAGGDGLLLLWDPATGKEKGRLTGHRAEVRAAAFVPSGKDLTAGKLLASASTDQTVRLWDLETGKQVQMFEGSPQGLMYALAASPDGKLVAAGDYSDGSVRVWDLATAKLLHTLHVRDGLGRAVMCLAFSPDSRVLAAGETLLNGKGDPNQQALIYLWDAATGTKLRDFAAHSLAVDSLAFSPDGHVLASTGWSDKHIALWDPGLGKKLTTLPCNSGMGAVAFSPDGKVLAWSGFPGDGIMLWELASKKLRHQFKGHAAAAHALTFSLDGRMLLSASMDTTALVWDVTGRQGGNAPAATPDQLPGLWKSLGSTDVVKAGRALWSLAAAPKLTVPWIAGKLRDQPAADTRQIAGWIAEFDSKDFKARQAAEKQMEALGKLAEPALRAALTGQPSLEVRQRVEKLLEKREMLPLPPETLQVLRALEVLEHVGTAEARQVLAEFARASDDGYAQHQARAAALRVANRLAPTEK